jgi:YD repeat-containing protein
MKSYSDGSTAREFYYDTTNHGYAIGRLTHASNDVNAAYDPTYDAMGRVTSQSYCVPSDCTYGVKVSAGYDLMGHMTSLTYPDGRVVLYAYDRAGRLSQVGTAASANAYLNVAAHVATGEWSSAQYGNSTQQTDSYNDRLQPQELKLAAPAGGLLADKVYTYGGCGGTAGNNGNICAIADAVTPAHNQSFSYDQMNRVQTAA